MKLGILKSQFKLITFDVTNTLLKFNASVGEGYSKAGKMYGVERSPKEITETFQHHFKIMNKNHPNFGQESGLSSRSWWTEMVKASFSSRSRTITNDQLKSISDYLYELYKSDSCWKVSPGAKDLLLVLKQCKVPLGVISNFDERLESVLDSSGLLHFFDFVLASYTVKMAKPDKKIFELALQHTPHCKPSDALHIGDNIELDYLASKAAGWNSFLIPSKPLSAEELKLVNPQELMGNFDDIKKYLLQS